MLWHLCASIEPVIKVLTLWTAKDRRKYKTNIEKLVFSKVKTLKCSFHYQPSTIIVQRQMKYICSKTLRLVNKKNVSLFNTYSSYTGAAVNWRELRSQIYKQIPLSEIFSHFWWFYKVVKSEELWGEDKWQTRPYVEVLQFKQWCEHKMWCDHFKFLMVWCDAPFPRDREFWLFPSSSANGQKLKASECVIATASSGSSSRERWWFGLNPGL